MISHCIQVLESDRADNAIVSARIPDPDAEVAALCYRSQEAAPGALFTAIPGIAADGHDYVSDAVSRGASAIVAAREVPVPENVALILVADPRRALAALADAFYGRPSQSLAVVGVTGTNAKTSVTWLVESIWNAAGYAPGVIGTISRRFAGEVVPSDVTTPESADLQRMLRAMADAGATHVILEVSSHALMQGRVRFVAFDAGVFTNLSQDHLDYHRTMESYFEAKKLLFTECAPAAGPKRMVAVVNREDPRGDALCVDLEIPVVCTGFGRDTVVRGRNVTADLHGVRGEIETPEGFFSVSSPLVGRHNFENILSAVGVAAVFGIENKVIQEGIEAVSVIPGRLERVPNDRERHVFVDYAHTDQALDRVLASIREIAAGRVITVMGCGGDRDREKRPLMGEAAARRSDIVIITSDNPRTEDPESIIEAIVPGAARHLPQISAEDLKARPRPRGFVVEPDRREAIALAVLASDPGDTVVIAGKGHEDYQILGREKRFFDDRVEAARALSQVGRGAPPQGRRPGA